LHLAPSALLICPTHIQVDCISNTASINTKRPTTVWHRPINAAPKALAIALSKAAIDAVSGKWEDAGKSIAEGMTALGLGNEPGELAWTLVHRALLRCSFELIKESAPRLIQPKESLERLANAITAELTRHSFEIDAEFFKRPAEAPFLKQFRPTFVHLMSSFGVKKQADTLADRLPSYFTFALVAEWRQHAKEYEGLQTYFETPFSQAAEREVAWKQYSSWLARQVDEPLFDELFGLRQIYVPLRGYWEAKSSTSLHPQDVPDLVAVRTRQRVAVDLHTEIERWLDRADPHDAIRVLSGGPGSGKSSFAKMLAAHLAANGRKVLFIPLHRFELTEDVIEAVAEHLKFDQFIVHNPLDPRSGDTNVFVIFDGLDELSMQGKLAAEVAQKFVREVERKTALLNSGGTMRLQSLIVGRELTIQANASDFRREGQILHTLPYYLAPREIQSGRYIDAEKLTNVDQRDLWWKKYGALSGKRYSKLPAALGRPELDDVTAQPLLNYLVALSYVRKKTDFAKNFNLNEMYADLLLAVYERGWAGGKHATLQNLDFQGFVRVLEEIALATWHGDGRTTTVREIEEHCVSGGLAKLLENFQEGVNVGVTRLLTAFYFRQRGQQVNGDKTFEFTHKSFGEYLIGLRLMRHMDKTAMMLKRREQDIDDGWDYRAALAEWIPITGPTAIDHYILPFIVREMWLRKEVVARTWQVNLDSLVGTMINHGIPMEKAAFPTAFREQMQWARNTSESLMTMRSRCAHVTGLRSMISFDTPGTFGTWIAWMVGQQGNGPASVVLSCLNHLDLAGCTLYFRDFFSAGLSHSLFVGSVVDYSSFMFADLTGVDMSDTEMAHINFAGADFTSAKLTGAIFFHCDFSRATFRDADARRTHFRGCTFDDARLSDANFSESNWDSFSLEGIDKSTARFDGAVAEESESDN
jgi:hypothetical protein